VLPVVNVELSSITHAKTPIVGFIGFHIIASEGGSISKGYFISNVLAVEGAPVPTTVLMLLLCWSSNTEQTRISSIFPEPSQKCGIFLFTRIFHYY
jgi:hypothetical protein